MNTMSKIASLLVVLAGFSFGQTAPASPPATAKAPDLTFKPNPQEEPAPAPPPAATEPDTANAAPKPATADAGGSGKNSGNNSATGAAVLPKLVDMPPYVFGANDVISVTVYNDSTVTGTYPIGPDGRISLPLIHDFTVIGLTGPQLQQLITEKLSQFMVEPVVNVQLLRNNSKKYTIIGPVGKPGPYPLLMQTTVLDALAACGGFQEFSNKKDIVIRRGTKEFHFNYKEALKGKHLDKNIIVQDGDIIIVKE